MELIRQREQPLFSSRKAQDPLCRTTFFFFFLEIWKLHCQRTCAELLQPFPDHFPLFYHKPLIRLSSRLSPIYQVGWIHVHTTKNYSMMMAFSSLPSYSAKCERIMTQDSSASVNPDSLKTHNKFSCHFPELRCSRLLTGIWARGQETASKMPSHFQNTCNYFLVHGIYKNFWVTRNCSCYICIFGCTILLLRICAIKHANRSCVMIECTHMYEGSLITILLCNRRFLENVNAKGAIFLLSGIPDWWAEAVLTKCSPEIKSKPFHERGYSKLKLVKVLLSENLQGAL